MSCSEEVAIEQGVFDQLASAAWTVRGDFFWLKLGGKVAGLAWLAVCVCVGNTGVVCRRTNTHYDSATALGNHGFFFPLCV